MYARLTTITTQLINITTFTDIAKPTLCMAMACDDTMAGYAHLIEVVHSLESFLVRYSSLLAASLLLLSHSEAGCALFRSEIICESTRL